jgi:acetoacetyl-CoA synthetase
MSISGSLLEIFFGGSMNTQAQKPLWEPLSRDVETSKMYDFVGFLNKKGLVVQNNYASLYDFSISNIETFWSHFWDYSQIIGDKGARILENSDKMMEAKWFPDSRVNYAENLLAMSGLPDDHLALVFWGEDQIKMKMSLGELKTNVLRLQKYLMKQGVGVGDRVVGFVSNRPETVVAMLATASLGAVWSSCSMDFGIQGVLDRFSQIQPKILFSGDGYFYNGKWVSCIEKVDSIRSQIGSLQKTIVIPYQGDQVSDKSFINWFHALEDGSRDLEPMIFKRVPFASPLFIMYSSGTTGLPKCIVHSVGGTLIQHRKEHLLHCDVHPGNRLFYYTTCGWMMWNWLVSGLASGACLMLYDGSPFYPNANILWDYVDAENIHILGVSAKYIQALEKSGACPRKSHRLKNLKAILSTGSPLLEEGFEYVYRDIKTDVRLSSISGGTDIISCFALGAPNLPVYKNELQCRGLGMAVKIFSEDGHEVRSQKGELVCVKPFPSQPIGFWNDLNNEKYKAAYFGRFPNIWCHGDFAELTNHDGIIIYGRSDTVLNPGGVRIGTSEIYRVVESFQEIAESMAIGQSWNGDERVVLFVRLKPDQKLTVELQTKIKSQIRSELSPRHVPAKIISVSDIPRTISGKISELAVRNVVHGVAVKNKEALANPDALALFVNLPELAED